jgi:hypothetical protein
VSQKPHGNPCTDCTPIFISDKAVVSHGAITVTPVLGPDKHFMRPVPHYLTVSFSAQNQTPEIRAIIGEHGEFLHGEFASQADPANGEANNGNVLLNYKATFTVPDRAVHPAVAVHTATATAISNPGPGTLAGPSFGTVATANPVNNNSLPNVAQGRITHPDPNYWYYCHNPAGYYPYVQSCTGEWQKVRPFAK